MTSASSGGSPPNPRGVIVAEWIAKAEADYDLAQREYNFTGRRNLDMIGFLLQQAIEKLMKAMLVDHGINPPKIYDLYVLDRLLVGEGVAPTASAAELDLLPTAAVQTRNPGASLSAQDVDEVMRVATSMWSALRPLI